MAKHSKDELLQTLHNLAKQLGRNTLSKADCASAISPSVIRYYFGSVGSALQEAGLQLPPFDLRSVRKSYGEAALFEALLQVETTIDREPRRTDCVVHCRFSVKPYTKRFGHWSNVLAHYRKWKADNPGVQPDMAGGKTRGDPNCENSPIVSSPSEESCLLPPHCKAKAPGHFYGEPIDFRGLRHAPINEQGVVFLFGMVCRELGFNVEAIRQGFPDCEAKYLHDKKVKLWAKARIEFEYKASAFRDHGHDPAKCDFVVCWINDWPDCPISVIELRKELLRLPSR